MGLETNLEKNWDYITYSIHHKKVVEYLSRTITKDKGFSEEVLQRLFENVQVHDLDKVFSYLFLEKKMASKLHRETSLHHMENKIPKEVEHYLEAICDYESAAYTKPDKPLNAYDTVLKYVHNEEREPLLSFLQKLGMDRSYNPLHEPISSELKEIMEMEVTKELVFSELEKYVSQLTVPMNQYQILLNEIKEQE